MSRRSSPCTQADLTRLVKAVLAAGVGVEHLAGVKLTRDGAVLLFGERKDISKVPDANEWDEVLNK